MARQKTTRAAAKRSLNFTHRIGGSTLSQRRARSFCSPAFTFVRRLLRNQCRMCLFQPLATGKFRQMARQSGRLPRWCEQGSLCLIILLILISARQGRKFRHFSRPYPELTSLWRKEKALRRSEHMKSQDAELAGAPTFLSAPPRVAASHEVSDLEPAHKSS